MTESMRFPDFDMGQVMSHNVAVLGMRFNNASVVKGLIEKLKSEIIALNTRIDDHFIVKRNDEICVHQLPKQRGMDLKEITKWATYNCKANLNKELGTISANDDTIVLCLNHSVCDGKYLVGIAEHIGDAPKKIGSYMPILMEEEFAKQIQEREKYPPKYFWRNKYNTLFDQFDRGYGNDVIHEEIFDVKKLACYDKKTQKCNGLTGALVTGFLLSVNAIQNKDVFDVIGGSMAANMRKELSHKPTLRHTNIFTVVNMGADVTPYTSLLECQNRIAKSLKQNFKDKLPLFDFVNSFSHPSQTFSPNNGIMTCFSHLGPVNVTSPADDLYIYNLSLDIPFSTAIPLLTYSIANEKTGQNELHAQLRHEGNRISHKKAKIINASFRHYLENYYGNELIRDAIKDLKAFQKSLQD